MSKLSNYCKAYYLKRLREYPEWSENPVDGLTGESVVYLHDSYIVTAGVRADRALIYGGGGESWRAFCANGLEFRIPAALTEQK